MSSNSLLDVPKSPADWNGWSFNHAQQHINLIQAIRKTKGIVLAQYQLDPINFLTLDAGQEWMERHQQSHIDFNGALGLQSSDLQNVDLRDPKQLQSFIYLNWQEHINANSVLRI